MGISRGSSPTDVVGASEGPDLGNINPDAQSFMLRALAAHIDRITAVVMSNKDAPIEQVEYEVDASNLTAGGQSWRLPSGAAIVAYYVENNSTAQLNVFAGGSGAGRAINTIGGLSWKTGLMPQQLTTLSIVPTSTTATGLVRVILTSVPLGPAIGSTIGAAAATPSTTAVVTTPTVTTTQAPILPANPNRVGLSFYNSSNANGVQLVFGGAGGFSIIVAAFGTQSVPGGSIPINWKGPVSAFTFAGTALLNITEFS